MSDESRSGPRPSRPSGGAGSEESPGADVLLVGDAAGPGDAAPVLRLRNGAVEAGELRAAEEGKPILGEVVKLTRRGEHARLFDVEVLARPPGPSPSTRLGHKGPARVSSDAYRSGWDAIFAGKDPSRPN